MDKIIDFSEEMSNFIFSPEWFYGIDSLFETFSLLITATIAIYAYRLYKFSDKKNYLYFSYAFILFSLCWSSISPKCAKWCGARFDHRSTEPTRAPDLRRSESRH